ncbi:unnamed protein product, partial [Polarella glacialis]
SSQTATSSSSRRLDVEPAHEQVLSTGRLPTASAPRKQLEGPALFRSFTAAANLSGSQAGWLAESQKPKGPPLIYDEQRSLECSMSPASGAPLLAACPVGAGAGQSPVGGGTRGQKLSHHMLLGASGRRRPMFRAALGVAGSVALALRGGASSWRVVPVPEGSSSSSSSSSSSGVSFCFGQAFCPGGVSASHWDTRPLSSPVPHFLPTPGAAGSSRGLRTARSAAAAAAGGAAAGSAATDGSRSQEEARRLLDDILGVVSAAGPQAGAVRSLQALKAAVLTAVDAVQGGEAQDVLQALQGMARGDEVVDDAPLARLLRKLFQRLGSTYVKLGQFIASSPTLFPAAYVREFQQSLDRTEPTSFDVVQRTLEKDLGRPLSAVFRSFEREALASASVAQVHSAVLLTGERVAVKVQKPGVGEVLQADLGFLYIAARTLEFLSPELARTSLVDLVSEIRNSMLSELDFRKELQHMDIFRKFLRENGLDAIAAAPRTYPEFSGEKVLTMELFQGVPLTDLEGIRGYSKNPEATLINALNVWALSVRGCELFHADVHAGNLLVLTDGRVGFIDFGIVGRVPPKIWSAIEGLTVAFVANDARGMARNLVAMGATDTAVDEQRLAEDVAAILARISGLQAEVVQRSREDGRVTTEVGIDSEQVTELLFEIVRATDANGLKLPREFALLVKQVPEQNIPSLSVAMSSSAMVHAVTVRLSWRLGLASALMVALGYPGEIQLLGLASALMVALGYPGEIQLLGLASALMAALGYPGEIQLLGLASALMVALGYPGEIQLLGLASALMVALGYPGEIQLLGLASALMVALGYPGGDCELELEAGLGQAPDGSARDVRVTGGPLRIEHNKRQELDRKQVASKRGQVPLGRRGAMSPSLSRGWPLCMSRWGTDRRSDLPAMQLFARDRQLGQVERPMPACKKTAERLLLERQAAGRAVQEECCRPDRERKGLRELSLETWLQRCEEGSGSGINNDSKINSNNNSNNNNSSNNNSNSINNADNSNNNNSNTNTNSSSSNSNSDSSSSSGARLQRHRTALLRNFDSVEQVLSLYLRGSGAHLGAGAGAGTAAGAPAEPASSFSLHAQFFIDLGIASPAERELFQASVRRALQEEEGGGLRNEEVVGRARGLWPAEAFRSYSWAAWLRDVDGGSRCLNCYIDRLEEQYDTLEQIVELYSERQSTRPKLDRIQAASATWLAFPQGLHLRGLLDRYLLSATCGSRRGCYDQPNNNNNNSNNKKNNDHNKKKNNNSNNNKNNKSNDHTNNSSGSGSGSGSGRARRDCTDKPESSEHNNNDDNINDNKNNNDNNDNNNKNNDNNGYSLDCQLFQQMGVSNAEHRAILEDWLLDGWRAESCAVSDSDQEVEASSATESPQHEMDPSGLLLEEYCATLQENYDTPEQVLRLYTEALVPGVWNPMFFEDCGVVRPEHQTLFAMWLSAARGRPSSPKDELAAAKPPPPALLHEGALAEVCGSPAGLGGSVHSRFEAVD